MGQIVKSKDAAQQIQALLLANKQQLADALPRHITPERVARVALTEMRKSPALLQCSRESLLSCIMQSSQLGLELGSGLGHAYLVPFKGACTLIIGYRGLVELSRRSGEISTIYAREVRGGDHFEFELGLEPKLRHIPGSDDSGITHVYAVAKLRDGGSQFEVMTADEVESIRKRSRASGSGPWATDWAMMARKTVLRRLCKMLPISLEVQRAIGNDEAVDVHRDQIFDTVPELQAPEAEPAQAPKLPVSATTGEDG